jgi:cytoskeletal protein CcmA (bactofilin family)
MYVEGALAAAPTAELERHFRECADCRASIAALTAEAQTLRQALLEDFGGPLPVPAFHRPLRVLDVAAFGAAAAALAWLASTVWSAAGAAVPAALRWLNPFDASSLFDSSLGVVVFLILEGTAMLTSAMNAVGTIVLIALAFWGVLAVSTKRHPPGSAVLVSIAMLAAALPSLGHALEIRRDALANVAAGETVDDTLIALGENIAIDGNVNGDLLAFGRRVTIRGNVSGNVISGAESIGVEGTIGGTVLGFGSFVSLARTRVARDVYAFGNNVSIDAGTEVAGNATTFANTVEIAGRVGIDLVSFARSVEIRGTVQRNVNAFAEVVTLLAPAQVRGNLSARVRDADDLQVATGATVGGSVDTRVIEGRERPSKYLTLSFYVRQAVRLGAAFVVGLLLLTVFPGLRRLSLRTAAEALRAGGIGLVAAIMLPVVSLLACITVLGIPLGIAGFMVWIIGLYFAKIVLAQVIGCRLFQSQAGLPHYAATLLAGLVIVLIAVNVSFLGGLANLVLTCVGLGLLVETLIARRRALG